MNIITTPVTCPVCKGINFSSDTKGLLIKKTVYNCLTCGSELESNDGCTFLITKVGEEYSNAQSLLEGRRLKLSELASCASQIPDARLALFAEGDIPKEIFKQPDQINVPIILKKDELIAYCLHNIELCEERKERVSIGGGSFSFRIAKGMWYHTSRLSEPQYANAIQTVDTGMLIITNIRYVFVGRDRSIDQPFFKITSLMPYRDGIGIAQSNKLKVEYFKGNYHWPIISAIFMGLVKKANRS